jgi:hypothetical protein
MKNIRSIDTGFDEDEYLFVYELEDKENRVEYDVFINDKKYKIHSPVKLESLLEYKAFVKQVALVVPENLTNLIIRIEQNTFCLSQSDRYYSFNDVENQPAITYSRFGKSIIEHWVDGKLVSIGSKLS